MQTETRISFYQEYRNCIRTNYNEATEVARNFIFMNIYVYLSYNA